MLDGDHRRHAVSHVRTGEVHILFLQDAKLSGVTVDYIGKLRLKAGEVGAALGIVDIVAEAQHVLVEFVDVLERRLHGNPFALPGKINDLVHRLLVSVHVLDKAGDSLRLMIGDVFRSLPAQIPENNGEVRIQVSRLVEPALYLIFFEPGFVKYGVVGKKIDGSSRLPGFSLYREQTVLQLYHRDSPLVFVFIDKAVNLDRHGHSGGKSVHHGGAHAMQAAAGLIGGVVKFSAGMQSGKYKAFCADALFVHSHRNSPPVVRDGCGAVRLQCYGDGIAVSG